MIAEVEAVMKGDLESLAWMDDATRQAALGKLARVENHVGYPDHWRDYTGLKVGTGSYLENSLAASVFESLFQLGRIGRPVDRANWDMPPTAVNAYYSSGNNKMVFPAGILQAPFYDHGAPLPVNYGAIGMVMGHELTHGFDDQGRKFDAAGNLANWWTPSVAKEFEGRAQCLADQYGGYAGIDGIHVNGKLTLGENIADQGGVKLSFGAWLAKSGGEGAAASGFTPKQQFFLGYAQSWCTKMRPEAQRLRLQTDPHSPPRFRVNGPLANFDEFAAAFSCKGGTPMAPEKRCKIW
jgi:endothelin-converting enzyme/putative endopeptidase